MPVLLLTRSAPVHDTVVPLCAAAGVETDVCSVPELALATWSDADGYTPGARAGQIATR